MGEPSPVADWLGELALPDMTARLAEAERREWSEARADAFRAVEGSVPWSYRWAFRREVDPSTSDRVALAGWESKLAGWSASPWIVLAGDAGSGKTSLAVHLLRVAVDRALRSAESPYDLERVGRVRFAHAYRLGVARIQHKAGDGEAGEVEDAMRAPLLVLDDVGSERDTANNALPDVIFERHAEGLQTWMTTGLTSVQIKARYGDGIARRMIERATVIKLGGGT